MGGLLFSGAFLLVVAVLLVRAARRRLRLRRVSERVVVGSIGDVDRVVDRIRCGCGRRFDRDGEGPRAGADWGVALSCVCGARKDVVFVVGN